MKKNIKKRIYLSLTFSLLFCFGFNFFINDTIANTWVQRTNSGSRFWVSLTSSSNATKLAGVVRGGYIYTSSDGGANWTPRTGPGIQQWTDIASSADGTRLIASRYGTLTAPLTWSETGYIYTSTDSGATWVQRTSAGARNWRAVASSADGTKLIAASSSTYTTGYIYTSSDGGATWVQRTSPGLRAWNSVGSSSDGTKLVVVSGGHGAGRIYTSTDSGANWTYRSTAGNRHWYDVTSSSDGTKLAVVVNNGYGYTSTDSGATWVQRSGLGSDSWYSIASSADGTKLLVTQAGSFVYLSSDGGVNWIYQTVPFKEWYGAASSSDGINLAIAASEEISGVGGYVYTTTLDPVPPVVPPTLTLSATPSNVNYGAATNLTWNSTNVTTCTASGGWTGTKSATGSQIISNLTAATTFTLVCTGPGGSVTQSTTVTVNPQIPTVNLSASPISVMSGASTDLSWTSTNATSCTASGDWSGTKAINSASPQTISNITSNKTFTLTCTNASGGTASSSVSVSVILPISVSLTANPATVAPGGTTQLTWTTTNNPTTCTASDGVAGWPGSKGANGGSQILTISSTVTFTISCTKGAQTVTDSVVVTVIQPINVSITATPNPVAQGGNVTLNWNGDNADTCTASSTPVTTWIGSKNTIGGTEVVNSLQQDTTFTITCTRSGVNASANVLVNLIAVPVVTLTANPSSILSGGSTVVTWSVTNNPDSCVASNGWNGNKSTSGGTETITDITQNTTFTLACFKDGVDIVPKSATVSVYPESLSLNSTRVLQGKTTLRWTAVNMTSCVATTENPNSGLNWEGAKTSSPSPYTGQTTNVSVTAADTADLNLKNRYILSCVGTLSGLPRSVILHLDINDGALTGIPNYQEN